MSETITTLQVDGVGLVELPGVGPWRVREITRSSFDIHDSAGARCNPHVTASATTARPGTKRNMNVVFADKAIPNVIVSRFNSELGK